MVETTAKSGEPTAVPLQPLNHRAPAPADPRRLTPGTIARAIPRRAARAVTLGRLAWNGVVSPSVSQAEPSHPLEVLSGLDQRLMRLVLLLRGLSDSNSLGTRTLSACSRRMLARLEEQASPAEPAPVPIVSWSDGVDALYENWVRLQRPVVIRGLPAGAWRWTVEWLLREHGDTRTELVDSASVTFENKRLRDLETPAPDGGPFYVHNHIQVFLDVPQRLLDVPLELLARLVRREVPRTASLFVSVRPGTGSLLHCANNLNTFMMIEGRKRWVLVDPSHLLLVYPYLSHNNLYQLSLVRKEDDADRLPLYRYCPRQVVDLEPGDCLLVPSWWYHSVTNLEARTLAAAVRWMPFQRGEVCTNALFRFLVEATPSRVTPGVRPLFEDVVEDSGTDVGRACWGLAD